MHLRRGHWLCVPTFPRVCLFVELVRGACGFGQLATSIDGAAAMLESRGAPVVGTSSAEPMQFRVELTAKAIGRSVDEARVLTGS